MNRLAGARLAKWLIGIEITICTMKFTSKRKN